MHQVQQMPPVNLSGMKVPGQSGVSESSRESKWPEEPLGTTGLSQQKLHKGPGQVVQGGGLWDLPRPEHTSLLVSRNK